MSASPRSLTLPQQGHNNRGVPPLAATLRMRRRATRRHTLAVVALLLLGVVFLAALSLSLGNTNYSPAEVWLALTGQHVPGASYAVKELRLPRTVLGLVAGLSLGAGGATFQMLLRNQLASPDIIGISAAASAAGAVGIVLLGLSATATSVLALLASLLMAAFILMFSFRDGFSSGRFILVGIGCAAVVQSIITYTLSKASAWDLPTVARWMTGSLNGATWTITAPAAVATLVCVPVLCLLEHQLRTLLFGQSTAISLGMKPRVVQSTALITAVAAVAVATAACGPIAFVAFMSGPIAVRLCGYRAPRILCAALLGALLVMGADLVGSNVLGTRYPVGVVTGALGAPFLIAVLIRSQRNEGGRS